MHAEPSPSRAVGPLQERSDPSRAVGILQERSGNVVTSRQARKRRLSSEQEVIIGEDQRVVLKAQAYQAATKKIKTTTANMQATKKK